jgi:lipoate---protein ligase
MDIHDDMYVRLTPESPLLFELWEPAETAVVIGYSEVPAQHVNEPACLEDNIPVIKRKGGGGAVVLMPGILCLSIAFISHASGSPHFYFSRINTFLISILREKFYVRDLHLKGISDIAIGDRKILGCSMFKSKTNFFYQGSLLVCSDSDKMEKYLLHPTREPDYRAGRPHAEFVTSLVQAGYPVTLCNVRSVLKEHINHFFYDRVMR